MMTRFCILSDISSMNIMNRKGHRLDPWGNPVLIDLAPEYIQLMATFITMCFMLSFSQDSSFPCINMGPSVWPSGLCALSNALLMSRQFSLASCFSPVALCSCYTMYVTASPVEWPALNPKCLSEIRCCLHTYFQTAEHKSLSIILLMMPSSDPGP